MLNVVFFRILMEPSGSLIWVSQMLWVYFLSFPPPSFLSYTWFISPDHFSVIQYLIYTWWINRGESFIFIIPMIYVCSIVISGFKCFSLCLHWNIKWISNHFCGSLIIYCYHSIFELDRNVKVSSSDILLVQEIYYNMLERLGGVHSIARYLYKCLKKQPTYINFI